MKRSRHIDYQMIPRFSSRPGKYQIGGDDSSSFFNALADYALANQQQEQQPEEQDYQPEQTPEESQYSDTDYEQLQSNYDELSQRYQELQDQQQNGIPQQSDDAFLNFLFENDNSNLPMTFDNTPSSEGEGSYTPSESSSGMMPTLTFRKYLPNEAEDELKGKIAEKENVGVKNPYNSVPRKKDGSLASSAAGKYQFLWSQWGDSIRKVTGVENKQEFLNNPDAQEKFFSFYNRTVLQPQARKVLPQLRRFYPKITENQAKMMIHFGGIGNVQKALKSGNFSRKLDAFGQSLDKYAFQNGGQIDPPPVAMTSKQQYEGLNNEEHDEMYFPNEGYNTFRGLDNGKPVFLQDELGKKIVLKGKSHTTKMYGNVYEKRLKRK